MEQKNVQEKVLDLRQKPRERASFIDRDGVKYFVPSDIPLKLAQRYYEIDFENFKSKDNEISVGILRDILCLENSKDAVEKLFEKMLSRDFVYISNFISEYMNEVNSDKKKV